MKKTIHIVLLSGGLDSTACLLKCIHSYRKYDPGTSVKFVALTYVYGQRAEAVEVERASRLVGQIEGRFHKQIDHEIHELSFPRVSPLISTEVDGSRRLRNDQGTNPISAAFLPGRNLVFLAHALSVASRYTEDPRDTEVILHLGSTLEDKEPDCSLHFIRKAMAALCAASHGYFRSVGMAHPFATHSKVQVLETYYNLECPDLIPHTLSCYLGTDPGCGTCAGCKEREQALIAYGEQTKEYKEAYVNREDYS